MALAGGLSAQFGMADEVTNGSGTVGTGVTPSRFLEFNSETIKRTIERLTSSGLRPNRRVLRKQQWVAGREGVAGDIEFDLATQGFGLFFKHLLGGGVTSSQPNAGSFPTVWEHVFKVGALDGISFTSQVGVGDTNGTVRAFTWSGCKVVKWELMCDEDGFLKLKPTIDGISEATATALASASYAAAAVPLSYTGGEIKIGGAELPTKKFSLAGDTQQKLDRYFMRGASSQQKKEQLESGLRAYTGKLDVEFMGLTEYNRFVKGEEAEITAFFEGPTIAGTLKSAVEVTLPACRFDGEGPDVNGPALVDISLPFVAMDDAAGTGGVQIRYRTIDTAP